MSAFSLVSKSKLLAIASASASLMIPSLNAPVIALSKSVRAFCTSDNSVSSSAVLVSVYLLLLAIISDVILLLACVIA